MKYIFLSIIMLTFSAIAVGQESKKRTASQAELESCRACKRQALKEDQKERYRRLSKSILQHNTKETAEIIAAHKEEFDHIYFTPLDNTSQTDTALSMALKDYASYEMIENMLKKGASPLKDLGNGVTPLLLARQNVEIAQHNFTTIDDAKKAQEIYELIQQYASKAAQ